MPWASRKLFTAKTQRCWLIKLELFGKLAPSRDMNSSEE